MTLVALHCEASESPFCWPDVGLGDSRPYPSHLGWNTQQNTPVPAWPSATIPGTGGCATLLPTPARAQHPGKAARPGRRLRPLERGGGGAESQGGGLSERHAVLGAAPWRCSQDRRSSPGGAGKGIGMPTAADRGSPPPRSHGDAPGAAGSGGSPWTPCSRWPRWLWSGRRY